MGDHGLRISEEGVDVKTGTDLETLLTSKYAFFKGSTIVTGSEELVNADNVTVTIAHNLGYIPFYQARCEGFYSGFINAPGSQYQLGSGGLGMKVTTTADTTNIYLNIFQYDSDFGPLAGTNTYSYAVFIYKDTI
jgi:hypothetical protein